MGEDDLIRTDIRLPEQAALFGDCGHGEVQNFGYGIGAPVRPEAKRT